MNSRVCPVCNGKDNRLVRKIEMIVPTEELLQSCYSLVCCEKCGFIFANVNDTKNYDEFYTSMTGAHTTNYTITDDELYLNTGTANFLETFSGISKNAVILDIGCSYGVLLCVLKERGYSNLFGMDLDEAAINYLDKKGINARKGSISTTHVGEFEGKFDVIVMRHIIEHLYDPKACIENAIKWLKPTGKILIEVPNVQLYPKTSPFPGYFVEDYHINHFSLNSLANMMNEYQLIAHEASEVIYPTLRTLFKIDKEVAREICYEPNDIIAIERMFNVPTEEGKRLLSNIEKIKDDEIAIWGTSVHVHRLLTYTKLKDCNIQYFVDRSVDIQGKKIMGKVIQSPDKLKDFKGTIVISGKTSKNAILKEIQRLGYNNKVVCLTE